MLPFKPHPKGMLALVRTQRASLNRFSIFSLHDLISFVDASQVIKQKCMEHHWTVASALQDVKEPPSPSQGRRAPRKAGRVADVFEILRVYG